MLTASKQQSINAYRKHSQVLRPYNFAFWFIVRASHFPKLFGKTLETSGHMNAIFLDDGRAIESDRQVCSSIANATKRSWWGRFYHIWREIGLLLASVCMYVFSARELASFTGQIFLHHQFPGMSPKLWLGLSAFCLERPALGGENSIRSVLHWRVAFLEN